MPEFQSVLVFNEISKRLDASKVNKVGKKFLFNIKSDDGKEQKSWLVDLTSGSGSVKEGSDSDKADCTITIKDSDFVKLTLGKLNPQSAFMTGKLKVKGLLLSYYTM